MNDRNRSVFLLTDRDKEEQMESLLEWSATLTGIFAAITVSLNLGARITGIGFIVFTVSSVCWVAVALLSSETPLAIQNGVLFVINCVGIYRYLIVKPHEKQNRQSSAA